MKILVTGGGGFLGQAICSRLVNRGLSVVSFNRGLYPGLAALGVRQVQADLANFDALAEASAGVDAIFHVGAKAGAWGSFRDYFDANVRGTRNVIAACRLNGVRTLVYTSTPSVTHQASTPVAGLSESRVPLATGFKAWYPATKRIAEEAVLEANGPDLLSVALRPRLIWGPGDNHLLPRMVERARAGRLRFVGDGLLALPIATTDDDPNAAIYADAAARARAAGVEVIEVPSPGRIEWGGMIQPASYMNFVITSHLVVVPTFGSVHDAAGVEAIGALFPDRQTIGLMGDAVLVGGGGFHCASQQMPSA
jgi:nucleoside-diphosphate-sugar epimerase